LAKPRPGGPGSRRCASRSARRSIWRAWPTRDDPIGLLLRSLDSLAADPGELQSLAQSVLADLGQKAPADLRGAEGEWALDSLAALADALARRGSVCWR
jgi:hypothetical protein